MGASGNDYGKNITNPKFDFKKHFVVQARQAIFAFSNMPGQAEVKVTRYTRLTSNPKATKLASLDIPVAKFALANAQDELIVLSGGYNLQS